MNNFSIIIKISGELKPKKIFLKDVEQSKIYNIVKDKYSNAIILSFTQI